MSAPGPDRAGEVIAGKYRLHRRLGTGGMAEVWSATNRFTEKQVAIKLLGREITEKEPETKQRFLNEAKVSARIDHPNVIDVIDVGQTDDGQLFIVMELLTGVSLETALHRQVPPMTFHELAHVMIDVASAMEAAHASGVVHRDLKPANIFLHKTKTGVRPTVLDFGVAKFRTARDDGYVPIPELTIAGTVLGSPLYMSPEQARGETDVDGRADIFAFGGILYEAITGHRAFEAKNFNALIVKIATTRPKSIDDVAPQVPESLRKVVRVCLEPDLQKRATSFTDVLALLRAAVPDLAKSNQRLPALHLPPALIDPERTNAMPVFAVPEHTRYEAALAPRTRESSPPSPWLVFLAGALIIAGLAVAAQLRSKATPAVVPATSTPAPVTELVIASSPSPCRASVDGVDRGDTPITIVTPGEHDVSCKFANGQVRATKLTLTSGTTSRYRFFIAE